MALNRGDRRRLNDQWKKNHQKKCEGPKTFSVLYVFNQNSLFIIFDQKLDIHDFFSKLFIQNQFLQILYLKFLEFILKLDY